MALADKAAGTMATLAEALDQHRGRRQQQITVKRVTVNADQAVVADQVVNGDRGPRGGGDAGLTHEISVAGLSLMNDDVPSRLRGEDHVHRKPGPASR